MFAKKKKKPQISLPTSFVHRVHTGFDKREGRYVGLPPQWASIVGNNQILKSTNRPLPLVDPSEITPTEILDLKTIVRPHSNFIKDEQGNLTGNGGIVLPKTSHVARSNSLRSSSPPRVRRDLRGNANVPPSVPEEPINMNPQYPSMRRDGTLNSRPQSQVQMGLGDSNLINSHQAAYPPNVNGNVPMMSGSGNGSNGQGPSATGPVHVHTLHHDMPPHFRYLIWFLLFLVVVNEHF